jgi:hypothetical protein
VFFWLLVGIGGNILSRTRVSFSSSSSGRLYGGSRPIRSEAAVFCGTKVVAGGMIGDAGALRLINGLSLAHSTATESSGGYRKSTSEWLGSDQGEERFRVVLLATIGAPVFSVTDLLDSGTDSVFGPGPWV